MREVARPFAPTQPGIGPLESDSMPEFDSPHVRAETVDDVIVLTLLVSEVRTPILAASVGKDLGTLIDTYGAAPYVLNLKQTRYMSSTAFAMLLNLAKKVTARGGTLKLCEMDPEVRIGADIIGLGRFVPIVAEESVAVAMSRQH
jgi:anti-anti-sigma factor